MTLCIEQHTHERKYREAHFARDLCILSRNSNECIGHSNCCQSTRGVVPRHCNILLRLLWRTVAHATQSSSSSLSSSPASCVCKRTGHRLSTIVVEGEATVRLYHLRKKDLHMKTSHVDNMCHSTHICEIMNFHKIEP